MRPEAHDLDQLVREWWLRNGGDAVVQRVLEIALTSSPTSLVPSSRALAIVERNELAPTLEERVGSFRDSVRRLRDYEWQLDQLGDWDNEPEAVFEILGDLAANVKYDPEAIRRSRIAHQGSRASAASALVETLGWDRLPSADGTALQLALSDLSERERYESWGLFVGGPDRIGIALGIQVVPSSTNSEIFAEADAEAKDQVRLAMHFAGEEANYKINLEWPATFTGESLGLPLYVAALVARGTVARNALIAATGRLDISGKVCAVYGISEKVKAAKEIGIRRVLIPTENLEEAKKEAGSDLHVIPVASIDEVLSALRSSSSSIDIGHSTLIRLVRASVREFGLVIQSEEDQPNGRRIIVASTSGSASIWVYSNGRVRADGKASSAFDSAKRLIDERIPPNPTPKDSLSFVVPTSGLQEALQTALIRGGGVAEDARDYELWRIRIARGRSRASVVLFASAKCVLQGSAPAWDVAFEIANKVTSSIGGIEGPAKAPLVEPSPPASKPEFEPHIGTDESGKGDYFGPLVSAAAYVDAGLAQQFLELGVRDSKALSDKRVRELAAKIRRIAEGRYAITPINPPKLNELYDQFKREKKNLNSLLAWGHARSLGQLLNAPKHRGMEPKYVLVDQFGDERYIDERTRQAGIPIHQRTKAESDIAVAAASVLARDAFLNWLEQWSKKTGVELPKGASARVIESGKVFVRRWGRKNLRYVAKLNFKTTQQVLNGEEDNEPASTPAWAIDEREQTSES